jgi:CO dehydrogenase maturation factor
MGGVRQAGAGCLCPEYTLLAAILRHMPLLVDEVVLLDTQAGMEHFGRAIADGFDTSLIIADPSYNALSVACESAHLACQTGIKNRILIVNRYNAQGDSHKVKEMCGEENLFSRLIYLPSDPEVVRSEPVVTPFLGQQSHFMGAMRTLADLILLTDLS